MKINLSEWTYIGKYNPVAKWMRPLCSYSLEKKENGNFRREVKIPMWFYILTFVPFNLIKVLWCMWDGGLKEFEIAPRLVGYDNLYVGEISWDRAKEIWTRRAND